MSDKSQSNIVDDESKQEDESRQAFEKVSADLFRCIKSWKSAEMSPSMSIFASIVFFAKIVRKHLPENDAEEFIQSAVDANDENLSIAEELKVHATQEDEYSDTFDRVSKDLMRCIETWKAGNISASMASNIGLAFFAFTARNNISEDEVEVFIQKAISASLNKGN